MYTATKEYKNAMLKTMRNRSYISVGIGIVNQMAQADAAIKEDNLIYYSTPAVFDNNETAGTYATLEENFIKCDGSMYFLPEYDQYIKNGVTTENFNDSIVINFGQVYEIKGITLEFAPNNWPTSFKITAGDFTETYTNEAVKFSTSDYMGEADSIIITPLAMSGGVQRFRITKITMGTGLTYTADDVESLSVKEENSGISAELPSTEITVTILDRTGVYDVNNTSGFLAALETGQDINVSIGQKLANGTIEWIPTATGHLTNWASKKGKMTFTAKDRFNFMQNEYTAGYKVYERTAYAQAVDILKDAGFTPDMYLLDDCLKTITLNNPMPKAKHKECLQYLCNACRCMMYENEDGIIVLKAKFETVIDPDDVTVTADNAAASSNTKNVLVGATTLYADMSKDFIKCDGSFLFMPEEGGTYAETTGVISADTADSDGKFSADPKLTLTLEAAYTYYGIQINFDGQAPNKIKITTYNAGEEVTTVEFSGLEQDNYFNYEFASFDTITIEVLEAPAGTRTHINKIAFGDLSDYSISKHQMTDNILGVADEKIKNLYVKIFTYTMDDDGNVKQTDDAVYYTLALNETGENKYCNNPLISTEAHAKTIAEWLGNYYSNNLSYSVEYRGEPRLHAADIIEIETDSISNLQAEVEQATLTYNGALHGSLELRKAVNMVSE